MTARNLRIFFAKWKFLIFACCLTYLFVIYIPIPRNGDNSKSEEGIKILDKNLGGDKNLKVFNFNPIGKEPFVVEEVLSYSPIKLAERLNAVNVKKDEKRLILSWNSGLSSENLNGCPDWNCEFSHDRKRLKEADAVIVSHQDAELISSPHQYLIYFSQESPVNSGITTFRSDLFNMTFGFRHDTPAGSPYGYTVKLAPSSKNRNQQLVEAQLISSKSKGAAWFVSHCDTNSKREVLVKKLQKYFPVDVYGVCGELKCPRSGECEKVLDTEYHFYVAFENSICKDYVTEKLWRQGYQKTIIPLVLKRSIVEPFVPPHSFIAVDDFKSVHEMANYLDYLMKNKTAYIEYFDWRRDYKVIFLDGNNHDILEKPWGICQICRVLWTDPREKHLISNWDQYWTRSCEKDGELVNSIAD